MNIDEKIEEDEGKIKVSAEPAGKSKLTESEMREMRRKQQEHAVSVQRKIDEELRKASSQVESESSADEDEKETEPEAEENSEVVDEGQSCGTFYFEDMLKEYESSIDRESNQLVEKALRAKTGSSNSEQDRGEIIKTVKPY